MTGRLASKGRKAANRIRSCTMPALHIFAMLLKVLCITRCGILRTEGNLELLIRIETPEEALSYLGSHMERVEQGPDPEADGVAIFLMHGDKPIDA